MLMPFLPLLQTHVLAQSESDIRNSLLSVREFIDDCLLDKLVLAQEQWESEGCPPIDQE